MKLIKRNNDMWSVFDEATNTIVIELGTPEEVVEWMLETQKTELINRLRTHPPDMTWNEAQFLAGRFHCCDCKKTLDKYEPKWPLERQRCNTCRSQY
jgi:hypothetical protein